MRSRVAGAARSASSSRAAETSRRTASRSAAVARDTSVAPPRPRRASSCTERRRSPAASRSRIARSSRRASWLMAQATTDGFRRARTASASSDWCAFFRRAARSFRARVQSSSGNPYSSSSSWSRFGTAASGGTARPPYERPRRRQRRRCAWRGGRGRRSRSCRG